MLQWLIDIEQRHGGVFSAWEFIFAVWAFLFGGFGLLQALIWIYKRLPPMYRFVAERASSLTTPEYWQTRRERKIEKLMDKREALEHFSDEATLETLSNVFSYLGSGLYCFTFVFFVFVAVAPLLLLTIASTLEAEILRHPVHVSPAPWGSRAMIPFAFLSFFGVIAISFTQVSLQAAKLSPKWRQKRITSINNKLGKLGVQPIPAGEMQVDRSIVANRAAK